MPINITKDIFPQAFKSVFTDICEGPLDMIDPVFKDIFEGPSDMINPNS